LCFALHDSHRSPHSGTAFGAVADYIEAAFSPGSRASVDAIIIVKRVRVFRVGFERVVY
jgi:hypothetical protein